MLLENKFLRQNIITLKEQFPSEFGRFIVALKNLEESEDWARICGIHGNTFNPSDPGVLCPTDPQIVTLIAQTGEPTYCPHSHPKFVAWHTPYIFQFETLLNLYNSSTNKEYITLPYLDLTNFDDDFTFINEPTITIEFDGEIIEVPNPLSTQIAKYYVDGVETSVLRNGYLSPTNIRQRRTLNNVNKQLENCLLNTIYEKFSTKTVSTMKKGIVSNVDLPPVESPHNTIHDVIGGKGGNMSDISISAFDPLFWLHHCNIDRFFYNWLFDATNGFARPLDNTQISAETLEQTFAPFFPGTSYTQDPTKFGWENNTFEFQKFYEILNFELYPYTYNKITKLFDSIKTYGIAELVDIPIPLESVEINFYLYPKSIDIGQIGQIGQIANFDKENYLAGIGYYFGINRTKKFCARCYCSRTNITIDISDYLIEHNITIENINEYNSEIVGIGLNTSNTFYTQSELLFDGLVTIIIN
jgi:hypothetical protein